MPLVRLADLSAWRFETSDLSETSIARVQPGAPVTITVDGLPGVEIAGTVESVGDYGASTQGDITFRVVVVPTGEVPAGLRWNMTVTMEIEGEPAAERPAAVRVQTTAQPDHAQAAGSHPGSCMHRTSATPR